MRRYSVTLSLKPVLSEDGDKDVATAISDVQAVTITDGGEDTAVDAACDLVTAAFGASTGLKVFIDTSGSPSKAQVIAALEAVAQQVRSCSLFS